jgi:hypothetical protein
LFKQDTQAALQVPLLQAATPPFAFAIPVPPTYPGAHVLQLEADELVSVKSLQNWKPFPPQALLQVNLWA